MSFRLLLLSQPEHSARELAVLPALFEAGLARFHVRKPAFTTAELAAYLQAIPAQYHPRLVLHAGYELALRYAVGGVHLTALARQQPGTARQLRQLPGRSVSASLHSLAEISRSRRRYEYVFLSPIFDSISKAGYESSFQLSDLQTQLCQWAARGGYQPPILALGGVSTANIGLLKPAGFAGAAVLGSLWQSPDPVAAFRQLQSAVS